MRKTRGLGRIAMGFGAMSALGAALLVATPALAGVSGGVVSVYPQTANVGDTFTASLTITNLSSGPNVAENVQVTSIRHTPSCGAGVATCDSPDAGVFAISGPVGSSGSACAGVSFSIETVDSATGEVEFKPAGAVVLGKSVLAKENVAAANCRIDFSVTVAKVPAVDADAAAGVQTKHLSRVQLKGEQSGNTGVASGSNATTVSAR